jgi:hypothetical protein
MSPPRLPLAAAFAALLAAAPARAHHGVAGVGIAGAEGPGAGLETTSALPLPRRTLFFLAKVEHVPYQQRDFAEPFNKDRSLYTNLVAGWGVRPWLSAYAFVPFSQKIQDTRGTSAGFADPSLMLALAFKWDEGFRLGPEKESLDELEDWHFSVWASSTLPVGSVTRRDDLGEYWAPDMQSGFGHTSPAVGFAVLKELSPRLTWLADASYQAFLEHDYEFTTYRFGGETRVDTALVLRAWTRDAQRLDVVGELLGLHLQRDREDDGTDQIVALGASGGAILYAGGGLRYTVGSVSAAAGIRRAAVKQLNEEPEQQGSEGLERYRATFSLSVATGL